jgi:uncharacterized coiled-coil DUF342 family protein
MNDETNRILEAILLVMEDQRKKMDRHSDLLQAQGETLKLHGEILMSHSRLLEKLIEGQDQMRGDIQKLYRGQEEMRGDIKELTRTVSVLNQRYERHDSEIEKIIDVYGTDLMDIKQRLSRLESKS